MWLASLTLPTFIIFTNRLQILDFLPLWSHNKRSNKGQKFYSLKSTPTLYSNKSVSLVDFDNTIFVYLWHYSDVVLCFFTDTFRATWSQLLVNWWKKLACIDYFTSHMMASYFYLMQTLYFISSHTNGHKGGQKCPNYVKLIRRDGLRSI